MRKTRHCEELSACCVCVLIRLSIKDLCEGKHEAGVENLVSFFDFIRRFGRGRGREVVKHQM